MKDFWELLQKAQIFDSAYYFLAMNLLFMILYLIIFVNFVDRNDPKILMQTKLIYFFKYHCPAFVVHLVVGFISCLILGKIFTILANCFTPSLFFMLFRDIHSTCSPQPEENSDPLQIIVHNVYKPKHQLAEKLN